MQAGANGLPGSSNDCMWGLPGEGRCPKAGARQTTFLSLVPLSRMPQRVGVRVATENQFLLALLFPRDDVYYRRHPAMLLLKRNPIH